MIIEINKTGAVRLHEVSAGSASAQGISVSIPGTTLEILQIRCQKGMLLCGLFDRSVLETLDFPAAIFSAPKLEDMIKNSPIYISKAAMALGATTNMTGLDLVKLFSQDMSL